MSDYVCSQEPHPGPEFYGIGSCAECGYTPLKTMNGEPLTEHHGHAGFYPRKAEGYNPDDPSLIDQRPYLAYLEKDHTEEMQQRG